MAESVPAGWEPRVEILRERFPDASIDDLVAALEAAEPRGHVQRAKEVLMASEGKRKAAGAGVANAQRAACLERAWSALIKGAVDDAGAAAQVAQEVADGSCAERHKFDPVDYKNPGPPLLDASRVDRTWVQDTSPYSSPSQ